MTTREQDHFIERMALRCGRVAVRDGFADKHIDVTADDGECWNVSAEGVARQVLGNFSIRWTEIYDC